MKKLFVLAAVLGTGLCCRPQGKINQMSIGIMNVQSAMPFGKFAALFSNQLHPGCEAAVGFNWRTKAKHDWIQEFGATYFYHRFVQHAFTLHSELGYRYRFTKHFSSQAMVGAGYLHSIPATAKLKLNGNGEYENDKGIGRAQAMGTLAFRADWKLDPSSPKPMSFFIQYQQLLQMPFIKSYVPFLPYNCLILGVSCPLKKTKNHNR
jgi:hypothetical protein